MMACTISIVVTCGLVPVIVGWWLIDPLPDLSGDEQEVSEDHAGAAVAVVVLLMVVFRVISTLEGEVTPWIFNGVVARSCAEVSVALALLKLALAALNILLR